MNVTHARPRAKALPPKSPEQPPETAHDEPPELTELVRELMSKAVERHGRECLADLAIFHATAAYMQHLIGRAGGIKRGTWTRYVDMAVADGDGYEVLHRLMRYAHYRPTIIEGGAAA